MALVHCCSLGNAPFIKTRIERIALHRQALAIVAPEFPPDRDSRLLVK